MRRRLRAALAAALRGALVLALACSPLAHPTALAALAVPAQAEPSGCCPHHAKAGHAAPAQPGDCCFSPGSACHCAMAAALPAAALPALAPPPSDHPLAVPRLAAWPPRSPEPPPPRA